MKYTRSGKYDTKGEEYIAAIPKLKKWINECICCRRKGYDPKMPDHISTEHSIAVMFIKEYFEPLYVNEQQLCEVCEKVMNKIDAKK